LSKLRQPPELLLDPRPRGIRDLLLNLPTTVEVEPFTVDYYPMVLMLIENYAEAPDADDIDDVDAEVPDAADVDAVDDDAVDVDAD